VDVVEIPTALSLGVIIGVLLVTVIISLAGAKGKAQNAVTATRHHALQYLEIETDPAQREEIFTRLVAELDIIKSLPEKYRKRIREEENLMAQLLRARDEHDRVHASAAAGGTGTGS
jgi:tellurite resistance protein TerC